MDGSKNVIGICGIARDITARKAMEETLRKTQDDLLRVNQALIGSESIYKTFAENAMDYIGVFDTDYNVIYINKAGAMGFKSTPDKVIGKNLKELIPFKQYERMKATLQKAVDTKELHIIDAGINFQGHIRWQQAHNIPIKDENGNVKAVMSITRDVTKYTETEKKLGDAKLQADL
jgi:two-component system sensor kinase FixL